MRSWQQRRCREPTIFGFQPSPTISFVPSCESTADSGTDCPADSLPRSVPTSSSDRMKGAPDREIGCQHQLDETLQRSWEGKAATELERCQAKHCAQVPSEALGGGILQPVRDIGNGKTSHFE